MEVRDAHASHLFPLGNKLPVGKMVLALSLMVIP